MSSSLFMNGLVFLVEPGQFLSSQTFTSWSINFLRMFKIVILKTNLCVILLKISIKFKFIDKDRQSIHDSQKPKWCKVVGNGFQD